jgi:hypothetical protein
MLILLARPDANNRADDIEEAAVATCPPGAAATNMRG